MSRYQYYPLAKFEKIFDKLAKENQLLVKRVNYLNSLIIKAEKQQKKLIKKNADMYYELDKDRDIYLCQICVDKPRDTVLFPCRHFFCEACVNKFETYNCPCCRADIEGSFQVII